MKTYYQASVKRGVKADPTIITQDVMVSNIQEVFNAANDNNTDALDWYDKAHSYAHELANMTDSTLPQAIAAIANTSFNAEWKWNFEQGNLFNALQVLRYGHDVTGINLVDSARVTLEQILSLRSDELKDYASILATNVKQWNFANNIYTPQSYDYLTIDGHAANIAAVGLRVDGTRPVVRSYWASALSSAGRYDAISLAYRLVAAKNGIRPNQLQAQTWHYYRTLKAWRDI